MSIPVDKLLKAFPDTKQYRVRCTFHEPVLGTAPKNKEVYAKYIQSKALDLVQKTEVAGVDAGAQAALATTAEEIDEEVNTVPTAEDIENKGWTGFHEDEGGVFLYNYVIKGFCKEAASTMNRLPETETKKIKAFLKTIDALLFVKPRRIHILFNDKPIFSDDKDGPIVPLERALRVKTPQGERVTLARSDTVPEGSTIEFEILCLGVVSTAILEEWLNYGMWRGLGQWRNAEYGAFTHEIEEIKASPKPK